MRAAKAFAPGGTFVVGLQNDMLHMNGMLFYIEEVGLNPLVSFSAQQTAAAVARIRTNAELTQSTVAEKAGLDQSRVSRIEKGEVASPGDVVAQVLIEE
jgi:Helix-turn-helix